MLTDPSHEPLLASERALLALCARLANASDDQQDALRREDFARVAQLQDDKEELLRQLEHQITERQRHTAVGEENLSPEDARGVPLTAALRHAIERSALATAAARLVLTDLRCALQSLQRQQALRALYSAAPAFAPRFLDTAR